MKYLAQDAVVMGKKVKIIETVKEETIKVGHPALIVTDGGQYLAQGATELARLEDYSRLCRTNYY